MFRQFSGQEESNSSLDFPRRDGGTFVVMSQARCFSSNTLKDVIHERVHDGHGFARDSSVGMDLLQNLVDVDSVRFLPLLLFLLVSLGDVLLGLAGLLCSLSGGFRCHDDEIQVSETELMLATFDLNLSKEKYVSQRGYPRVRI